MKLFVIIFDQVIVFLTWAYFTHHYLCPKESGWKRELIVSPIVFIIICLSATIVYENILLKNIVNTTAFFLIFCYIYKFDVRHFLITLVIIFSSAYFIELPINILYLFLFHKSTLDLTTVDFLILLPFIVIAYIFAFNWILAKSRSIPKLPNITFSFLLSQTLLGLIVFMSTVKIDVFYPLVILIIVESCFYIQFWRHRKLLFVNQELKLLHKRLEKIYQNELNTYLQVKNEEYIYATLRHDLLNEIQIISYIEKKETDITL